MAAGGGVLCLAAITIDITFCIHGEGDIMANDRKKSTRRLVIEHIANNRFITRAQALWHYRIQNLADVIMHLRREGWNIQKKIVKTNGVGECYYGITEYVKHCAMYDGVLILDEETGRLEAPFE